MLMLVCNYFANHWKLYVVKLSTIAEPSIHTFITKLKRTLYNWFHYTHPSVDETEELRLSRLVFHLANGRPYFYVLIL